MYKQVKNVVATVQVHNKVENSLSLLLFSAPLLTLLSPPPHSSSSFSLKPYPFDTRRSMSSQR